MKVISGSINKVEKVSFSPNELIFIGTYSKSDGSFIPTSPLKEDDMIFDVDENGNCWVTTDETLVYDEETGALYLFKEV